MYRESVGLIGGFGAYATLGFYRRMLEAFASESERNYPHIYMDNDFTMPSRTRALLYGDDYDEVVEMIAQSMRKMVGMDVDHIVMVCGTAHAFLPDVYKLVPKAREKVLHIIEILRDSLYAEAVSEVLVIAAEGTLQKGIYPKYLEQVKCLSPAEEYYGEIRFLIESVKQNTLGENAYQRFIALLDRFHCEDVVLGCTEFPALVEAVGNSRFEGQIKRYRFYDPLELTIQRLKKILK